MTRFFLLVAAFLALASPAFAGNQGSDIGVLAVTTTSPGYMRCKSLPSGVQTTIVTVTTPTSTITPAMGVLSFKGSWDIDQTNNPMLFAVRAANLTTGAYATTSTMTGGATAATATYLVPTPMFTRFCINYLATYTTSTKVNYIIDTSPLPAYQLSIPVRDVTAASSSAWPALPYNQP